MTPFALATFTGLVPIKMYAGDWIGAIPSYKRESAGRRLVSSLRAVRVTALSLLRGAVGLAGIILTPSAMAESAPSVAPPAVGVIVVERRPMTDSYEFNGRIQAINSVNIVARVTAWLDKQLFVAGTDVKKGDLLYTLERPPFQAAVDRQKAAVAQAEAQLANANTELRRAQQLVEKSAGTQQRLDNSEASQRVVAAQLKRRRLSSRRHTPISTITDISSPHAHSHVSPCLFIVDQGDRGPSGGRKENPGGKPSSTNPESRSCFYLF